VTPLNDGGRPVEFPYVDYMQDMVTAKHNAADFYYAHGIELMKSNIKESFRQAYYEFIRAKDYVGDYEGIDAKIVESKFKGMEQGICFCPEFFNPEISERV